MAICGGYKRVFEVGHVFRAESSNTQRRLCEFVGLDAEMEIQEHFFEVWFVEESFISFTEVVMIKYLFFTQVCDIHALA